MNETFKTISERFSCRDFTDTPLTDEQIKLLATAALASPSGMNIQPWFITMVTDKKLIDEMDNEALSILSSAPDKSFYERIKSRGGKVFYNAPCMVVVSINKSDYTHVDCGILSQNVALAAHSLGLGNVICAMASIPLSGTRCEEFKNKLKFPTGYDFGIAVLVGNANAKKEPHELDWNKVSYV